MRHCEAQNDENNPSLLVTAQGEVAVKMRKQIECKLLRPLAAAPAATTSNTYDIQGGKQHTHWLNASYSCNKMRDSCWAGLTATHPQWLTSDSMRQHQTSPPCFLKDSIANAAADHRHVA